MEEAQYTTSKPSQVLTSFPCYRRSHFKSGTYCTLVRILSHCYEDSQLSGACQVHSATQELKILDNGIGKMGQASQENESDQIPLPHKETQVHETFEGVGGEGKEFSGNKIILDNIEHMMGVEEDEDSSRRQDMMICESIEEMSTQADGFNKEQKLMDELEQIMKGNEKRIYDSALTTLDLGLDEKRNGSSEVELMDDELEQIMKGNEKRICDTGLTPLALGLDEKRNGSSEVELMDNHVEHVESRGYDKSKSGTASGLQEDREINQHASEGFPSSSLISNDTTSGIKEQSSVLGIIASSLKHERQQKEMGLRKPVSVAMAPITEEGELVKDEQCVHKVTEGMHYSLHQDIHNERDKTSLQDTVLLEAKNEIRHEEEQSQILICANDASTSSNPIIVGGDIEEGEISGDFGMNDESFGMSSIRVLALQKNIVDEAQKPKNLIENVVFPCHTWKGQKVDYDFTSFMVDTLHNVNNSEHLQPRASDRNGLACGVEVAISQGTIKCEKAGENGSMPELVKIKDKDGGSKDVVGLTTALANNQVLQEKLLEEGATEEYENLSKKTGVNSEKKRGPVSEKKKAKNKQRKRKKRAEKNRELGVKRLKLQPVQKPKTISHCRHYLRGRCHEGDKCKFSHDIVPLTKSTPCCHFARRSCMKGDDCPFDHQLSKYPCSNFVSRGLCSRGDACMFSHQLAAKQDVPTSSIECRPELKSPLLSGNTNFSKPLNISGSSASQQNNLSNSRGTHSHVIAKHEVSDSVLRSPTLAPKGISFINVAKSPLLHPSTHQQDGVTPKKGSAVQIGTPKGQSARDTAQKIEEKQKKMPLLAPKGINFLSFGKGRLSSLKSSVSSSLKMNNGIMLHELDNFGLPEQASSSLNQDDHRKVGDQTKLTVLQTVLYSSEIVEKNQSVEEGRNLNFPGKVSIDESTSDIQCTLSSQQHHGLSRSAQEGVKSSATSQASAVTSSVLPVSSFVSRQFSECLGSAHHKHTSSSAQKALLSTLAFAAKYESDIKMKFSTGAPAGRPEMNKQIENTVSSEMYEEISNSSSDFNKTNLGQLQNLT